MKDYFNIRIEPPINDNYVSCEDCIYYADEIEICVARRCIHAVGFLKECYIPKDKAESEDEG